VLHIQQKAYSITNPVKICHVFNEIFHDNKKQIEESSTAASLKRKALHDITHEEEDNEQLLGQKRRRIDDRVEVQVENVFEQIFEMVPLNVGLSTFCPIPGS
jgi:hypothetical protein